MLLAGCGFDAGTASIHGPSDAPVTPIDGRPADAAPPPIDAFVPPACPAGWDTIVGSTTTYHYLTAAQSWWDAEASCVALAAPGGLVPHLAVINNKAEAQGLAALFPAGIVVWIGLVQAPSASAPDTGWHPVTGGSAYTRWQFGEPNDSTLLGLTEAGRENFGELDDNGEMNDNDGHAVGPSVCECDGLAIDPSVQLLPP
jgi:hypothetical protein